MQPFVLLFLLAVSAAPLHAEEFEPGYAELFLGRTRDQVIDYMGGPSYTVKRDDGTRLMEYRARNTYVYRSRKPREQLHCTVRLWLSENIVHRIEPKGDLATCQTLIQNKGQPRTWTTNLRDPYR